MSDFKPVGQLTLHVVNHNDEVPAADDHTPEEWRAAYINARERARKRFKEAVDAEHQAEHLHRQLQDLKYLVYQMQSLIPAPEFDLELDDSDKATIELIIKQIEDD